MELTQLRYFLKVAELQHITKAANELYIAQPALTQTIHRLESELEVPLFANKGRNIVLTEYGHFFYQKLKPLLTQIYELPEQVRAMANLQNSTIHLNVLAASSLVTQAIIEYQKIDDSLHIQLDQNERSELYDICITTDILHNSSDLTNQDVYQIEEKIYVALPINHRLSDRKSVSLKELENEQFISLSGAKQFRAICDKYCKAAGIKPNIIFESDSPAAVKNMISANMGIGFWPAFSWERITQEKVKMVPIVEPECTRNIIITYQKNKIDNTKAETFYKFLQSYFEHAAKGEF